MFLIFKFDRFVVLIVSSETTRFSGGLNLAQGHFVEDILDLDGRSETFSCLKQKHNKSSYLVEKMLFPPLFSMPSQEVHDFFFLRGGAEKKLVLDRVLDVSLSCGDSRNQY